jgi:ribose transport system ATP-binding protein
VSRPIEITEQLRARTPQVEIRDLSKSFPGTRALVDVDLDIGAGEVQALAGGNGSGKSTLIKILSGIYRGDAGGTLRTGDHSIEADRTSPEFARSAGIHVVHQDLGVFLDMSVTENIALGYGYSKALGVQVRWTDQRERARSLIERFEIEAHPDSLLRELSQAVRTQVAIARALQEQEEGGEGLLILDEPTSSLPDHEVDILLSTLKRYASRGQAILYVTHRLGEILDLADSVSVLRDGRKVGAYEAASLTEESLIELILGRQIDRVFPAMPSVENPLPAIEVRGLRAGPLEDVSLSVARGEVVGIAGILGSGRTELLRAIFGDLPYDTGEIEFLGKAFHPLRPADAIRAGIAYVPENRILDAAFPDLSVAENIALVDVRSYWNRGWIARRSMRLDAKKAMADFAVKAAGDTSLLSTLSGGNQQKVVLARWLRLQPKLLLLDEPTQGVDVGAREEIYRSVRRAVADGAAAIIVASDFEELAHVSDRVVVLRDGRITAEAHATEMSPTRLMQAAHQGSIRDEGR